MGISIKRGYEILPNNNVMFGVRVTNETELVISDVQVIIDPEGSVFSLQGDRVQKLDNIPPATAMTAKFTLVPKGQAQNGKVEASIIYRDPKWEKHVADMRPILVQIPEGVVQRSNVSAGTTEPAVNVRNSALKQPGIYSTRSNETEPVINKGKSIRKEKATAATGDQTSQEKDIAKMYDSYLNELKSKQKENDAKNRSIPIPYSRNKAPSDKKLNIPRSTAPPRKKEDKNLKVQKKSKKKLIEQMLFILALFFVAAYVVQTPMFKESIGSKYGGITPSNETEMEVMDFLNAVNDSKFDIAFNMYQGKDFLVPASVQMLFSNGGIKAGTIKQVDVVSNEIEEDTAVIAVNCTVSSVDILGNEGDVSVVPIYFQLHDIEQGWTVTGVSFIQAFDIETSKAVVIIQE
ncbi:COG1361 family protein [Methanolobus profundi]|uniref:Uncharacterized protein n=1 Tax=Methanolobus profundi TaxID=487685 RepID=A0A1I4RBB0_9EURY|nr:hypothetical protein [Methanolobus profundi]SFM49326.1 hypothetical protein SAMN04488696_1466 [Methanolobus profundi]